MLWFQFSRYSVESFRKSTICPRLLTTFFYLESFYEHLITLLSNEAQNVTKKNLTQRSCFLFILAITFFAGMFIGDVFKTSSFSVNEKATAAEKAKNTEKEIRQAEAVKTKEMPGMTVKYNIGSLVLYVNDDFSQYALAKKPPQRKLPSFVLVEKKDEENEDCFESSYYGFGGDGQSILSLQADSKKGKITSILYNAQESRSYPYKHEKARYTYYDTDADGVWDNFIDLKEEKVYKRDGLSWTAISNQK